MMQYKVVTRKNPINKTKKFYPALVSPQPVDKTKIIERIEKRCTLASADVKAVLDALEVELIDCLQEGWSVRLGDFGSFRVSLRTKGKDKAEDVQAEHILSTHVVFTPSPRIRRALSVKSKAVKFVRQGEETDKKAAKPAGGVMPAPVPGA